MELIGVDYSGAKTDVDTWVATAQLVNETIVLNSCAPMTRSHLENFLSSVMYPSIVALDFPFSVPVAFAKCLDPHATKNTDVWAAVSNMSFGSFITLRDRFVKENGEIKRVCDTLYPESYSCLHKANPNLVPMTYYGMRMLHRLPVEKYEIRPFDRSEGLKRTVLLEVMPGSILKVLRLPYKAYKNGANAMSLRYAILDSLEQDVPIPITNLSKFRNLCLASHDALDAIVATIGAALWSENPEFFYVPKQNDIATRVEGSIHVPTYLNNL